MNSTTFWRCRFAIDNFLALIGYWIFFAKFRFNARLLWIGLPGCAHGPASWPWWKLFSIKVYRAQVHAPCLGWVIWIYTRSAEPVTDYKGVKYQNRGRSADFIIDRRAEVRTLWRSIP